MSQNQPPHQSESPEGLAHIALAPPDAARVFQILWRRKWHVLACAFFLGLAAFVWTARQPEMFLAETEVLLDPRKNNVVLSVDQIVSDLEFTNATVESEIERIASDAAIRAVVEKLGYDHLTRLDPEPRKATGIVGIIDWLKAVVSPRVANHSVSVSNEQRAINRVVQRIARGTRATRTGNSFVVKLAVTTVDAELSAEIANQLTQLYISRQVAERKNIAQQATRWHEAQLEQRRDAMIAAKREAETQQRVYLAQSGATPEVLSLQLSEMTRALAEARAQEAAANSRYQTFKHDVRVRGAQDVAETHGGEPFITLLNRKADLESDAQNLARDFGERHELRMANERALVRVAERLLDAVGVQQRMLETEVTVARARVLALEQNVKKLQSRIVTDSAPARELQQLEIEATAAKDSYEQLATRMAEIKAQADLQLPDARILSLAQIPTGPSAPRPKFMGFLGASVGASIGLFSVLAFEALGRGINSSEALEQLTGVFSISQLPRDRLVKAKGILSCLSEKKPIPIAERLRQLHFILEHAGGGAKVLLVTSALPKEGRSTVAKALSQISADTGRNTLLVRVSPNAGRGEFHYELNTQIPKNSQAKSPAFQEITIKEVPLALENGISDQFAEWRADYEAIVIDGNALLERSDGLLLAQLADQVLVVVEFLKTPKRSLISSLEMLLGMGVRPSALVLNKADTRLDPGVYFNA